tara:strand:+ start:510 stop:635 length:126 start_codon:yes stop_codon:yes gene_type:complete
MMLLKGCCFTRKGCLFQLEEAVEIKRSVPTKKVTMDVSPHI